LFFGSLDSSTSSDTCSGVAHFWAGFLDGTSLRGVLEDLRAGLFLLTGLSILSSGQGSIVGGPKLRVRGYDKDAVRGTLGEVVVFLWRLKVDLVVV